MSVSSSSFSSPWPDPSSPVLSKIDFGVPLVELFKWLDVRDTLLGQNYKKQDITAALALAHDCKHFDAEWLTSIFEGKDVSTKENAREIFLSCLNDARALCFAWWLAENREDDLMLPRRASEMGNAFACSFFFWQVWFRNEEEAFRLARLAANRHERDGFSCFGYCFQAGHGCKQNSNLAKENYLIAAELGLVEAAVQYGCLLDHSDPVRWLWWGRAALRGCSGQFLDSFSKQVELFFSGSGNATTMFLIGHVLKGNISMEKNRIFCDLGNDDFYSLIEPAYRAVSFYESQIESARLAVYAWALISTRLHLIKDMRIFIGKMIWEGRFEANYKFESDDVDSSSSSKSSLSAYLSSLSSWFSSLF